MRTKFKAWHKAEKKMCEVSLINFDKGAFLIGVEKAKDTYSNDGKTIIHAPENGRFCEWDEIELIQFTGLLDKNGVEIYEGDVLNCKTTFENNMADRRFQAATQREVSFKDGCFIDDVTDINLFDSIMNITYNPSGWTDFEVIGNIYENPELLK